jgi:hypothetical protein
MKGPKCGYEWKPKVENPKKCPRCNQPLHPYKKPLEIIPIQDKPSENMLIQATSLVYCPFCGAKLPNMPSQIVPIPVEEPSEEQPSEEEPLEEEYEEEPTGKEQPIEEPEEDMKPRKRKQREPKITDLFESSGFSEPFERSEGFAEALGLPSRRKEKRKKKVIECQ